MGDYRALLEHIREKRREIFGCSEISMVQEALEEIHEIEQYITESSTGEIFVLGGNIPR